LQRNATSDYARLIAALGIVLFHTGAPGASLGYAALPFFLMLMMLFCVPGADRGLRDFATSRAGRLLVPWLGWSLVYGGLKLAEVVLTPRSLADEFAAWMLLTGPAIHLWFLPFAFVASLLAWPLVRTMRNRPMAAGIVFAVAALAVHGWRQGTVLPVPAAQWVHALPAVLPGLGIGIAGAGRDAPMAGRKQMVHVTACVAAPVLVAAVAVGWTAGLLQLGLAATALLVCLSLRMEPTALSATASQIALTVYLCHPMIFALLLRLTPFEPRTIGMALAAMTGSILFAMLLDRVWRAGSSAWAGAPPGSLSGPGRR
jgi:surface polysaccharide O-acyltransferase-like enzyme